LVSGALSRQIAEELKQWITNGEFTLTEPVASLPQDRSFMPQEKRGSIISIE
jgi:uncharacterized protein (DUF39 family)